MKRKKILNYICLFFLCVPILFCGKAASNGIVTGLRIAGATVIPALFPYFVLSNLFLESGFRFPKVLRTGFQRLFHVSSEGLMPFVFSLIGGYPLGAKTVSNLYRDKKLTAQDANSLLLFCNNTGPAFFLGVAGGKILGSTMAGLLLYFIHVASAVFCGLLFRKETYLRYSVTRENAEAFSFSESFPRSVLRASTSMLNICAFVILFSGLQSAVSSLPMLKQVEVFLAKKLKVSVSVLRAVLSGTMEMTSGIVRLQEVKNQVIVFSHLSCLISWGGICVHFQTLSQLDAGINTKGYYFSKLIQALFSLFTAFPVAEAFYCETFRMVSLLPVSFFLSFAVLIRLCAQNSAQKFPFARKGTPTDKIKPKITRKRGSNSERNLV